MYVASLLSDILAEWSAITVAGGMNMFGDSHIFHDLASGDQGPAITYGICLK